MQGANTTTPESGETLHTRNRCKWRGYGSNSLTKTGRWLLAPYCVFVKIFQSSTDELQHARQGTDGNYRITKALATTFGGNKGSNHNLHQSLQPTVLEDSYYL